MKTQNYLDIEKMHYGYKNSPFKIHFFPLENKESRNIIPVFEF